MLDVIVGIFNTRWGARGKGVYTWRPTLKLLQISSLFFLINYNERDIVRMAAIKSNTHRPILFNSFRINIFLETAATLSQKELLALQ